MNRRGFLSAITAAAAGAIIDPERLIWVPGARLISIPRAYFIDVRAVAAYNPVEHIIHELFEVRHDGRRATVFTESYQESYWPADRCSPIRHALASNLRVDPARLRFPDALTYLDPIPYAVALRARL